MTLNIIVVAAIILLGILFMLIEIFLLPGITIAGVAGILFLVGGVFYSYSTLGLIAGHITLFASVVLLTVAIIFLVKSKALRKISLETNIDESVDNSNLSKIAPGDSGIALSRLNPIGKVMINDLEVEGKSYYGEFIEEGSEIEVVKVETYNILVKRK